MLILITGLSGSGKSTLAEQLASRLDCDYYNADVVRDQFLDYDFSLEGRIRQCDRMKQLCESSKKPFQIADFIAPTDEIRSKFDPDFIIWMNTVSESKYKDTDRLYQPPRNFNIEYKSWGYDLNTTVKWITNEFTRSRNLSTRS